MCGRVLDLAGFGLQQGDVVLVLLGPGLDYPFHFSIPYGSQRHLNATYIIIRYSAEPGYHWNTIPQFHNPTIT